MSSRRPRGRVREGLQCSWREACKAADYVLEHFGNRRRDRGIWVWYCQRLGLGTFLDLADETFDKERNALELALRIVEEIRLALADVVPTIVADENLTKLRVDNVMDLESPKPYNLIHALGIFRVAGYNMVLDDVGSAVYLTDKHGVTYEVVVDEVISKQLFKGHTAALLEPGEYKLVVKSRAGDAERPLQTAFRRVKYLKVMPAEPVFTSTWFPEGGDDPTEWVPNVGTFGIRGTNLDCFSVGGKLTAEWNGKTGEATITAVTPTELTVEQAADVDVGTTITYSATVGTATPTVSAT